MSYPDPAYLGTSGEVSARYRSRDTPPDLVFPNGTTVEYLVTGAGTDGGFGLYRWTIAPGPGGADLHFHRTISESFFVLSGTVTLDDGQRSIEADPGDYLYVPPGGLHGFANHTDEPASMLILFSPGAPREGYFEGLLELRQGREMSAEELAAFFVEHDNIYVDRG